MEADSPDEVVERARTVLGLVIEGARTGWTRRARRGSRGCRVRVPGITWTSRWPLEWFLGAARDLAVGSTR